MGPVYFCLRLVVNALSRRSMYQSGCGRRATESESINVVRSGNGRVSRAPCQSSVLCLVSRVGMVSRCRGAVNVSTDGSTI